MAGPHQVTRHADAQALLRDERLAPPPLAAVEAAADALGVDTDAFLRAARVSVNFARGARHAELTRSLSAFVGPRAVDVWTEAAGAAVEVATRPLEGRQRFDGVKDLATPIATRLIERLCGVPEQESERVAGWLEDITALIAGEVAEEPAPAARALGAANTAVAELTEGLERWMRDGQLAPLADGHPSPPFQRAVEMIVVAQSVGITLRDQIAMALWALASHPGALTRFSREPALRPRAIEELLRFAPTDCVVVRTLTSPLEVSGETWAPGDEVAISLAEANRDPDVFERPDELWLDRAPNPHLSFSYGPHGCPAQRPATAVLTAALVGIAEIFPELRIDREVDVEWRRGPILERPARLWLVRASA